MEKRMALEKISLKLRDVLKAHAEGKPIIRDMAKRIAKRAASR